MARKAKYGGTQLPLIAFEVVRAGKVLSRAVTALREEYESFRGIDYRIVSTLMKDANFRALVATAEEALAEKYKEEVRELARADTAGLFNSKPQPTTGRKPHGKNR